MADRLDTLIAAAQHEGLLPDTAGRPDVPERSWPIVLLTALGAWLAALPLMTAVGLWLGPWLDHGPAPYVVGLLTLAAAVVVLRARSTPLFVEQLAVPGLLVGVGLFGFALYRDLPVSAAGWVLAAITLSLGLWLRQTWLQVLWGAATAVMVLAALMGAERLVFWDHLETWWWVLHLLVLMLVFVSWVQSLWPRHSTALESLSSGAWLVVFVGLAVVSGMTFLVGSVLGAYAGVGSAEGAAPAAPFALPRVISVLLVLGGTGLAARRWRSLRHPAIALAAVVLAALAWWMPTLGAVVLALCLLATAQRWRLCAAAAVTAVWIVGAFYYALAWPLSTKAWVLAGAGALIGVAAWWMAPRRAKAHTTAAASPWDRRAAWVALGTTATLLVVGGAIWQKQSMLAEGQPVYVALAPVDPRSLMQGDYMRLNFQLPPEVRELPVWGSTRPKLVARRDANGVATWVRVATPHDTLAPGEFWWELTPKSGGWTLVTDAWFFREGDGERWARARYGEFRVTPDGRALLVGMADEQLQAIVP